MEEEEEEAEVPEENEDDDDLDVDNRTEDEEEVALEESGSGGESERPSRNGPAAPHSERKSQNVAALVRGNLNVKRQPLIPRLLFVSDGAAIARKPFKPPCPSGYSDRNEELVRRLWARKRFVPWGSSRPALVAIDNILISNISNGSHVVESTKPLPPGIDPLVLWQPEESGTDCCAAPIIVDNLLVKYLRPHQREGVQFMFDCVSGLSSSDGIAGCILADDMGLGKTLQSITLLYTLLCQGFDGKPMVRRALIVTPTSLVSNWDSEISKWLEGRIRVLPLCESSRADVVSGIDSFLGPHSPLQVLIISYETFRMHSLKFEKSGSCDLLICDEAHRLKNDQTLINRALAALPCRRRILLSGTPMQNDLEEFFAMVNFTNPGILGDAAYFRRYYEIPIISGREPAASSEERQSSLERSSELSGKVNQFILRRTNTLLSNHLPPKIVEVVCCKLTPLQLQLYYHFIESKNVKRAIAEDSKQSKILAYITALKKLCNHPKLIYDTIKSGSPGVSGFDDCLCFFPPGLFSGRSGSWTGGDGIWIELSGKMHVLARLLAQLRQKTDDRIVLVSNYTQTLDLFVQLCRERRYPYLRLDGTTSIGKRQKLVNRFNDQSRDEFAFLLSSKAGGCGLNLIGGNRLVLFDPDWNPANDKQAAARVWRDGQKKRVYIYRFLSTGTIEEKVYQRQMSKEGLQKVIQQEQMENQIGQGNFFSQEDLRDLFSLHENVRSEIHENMNCTRCQTNPVATENNEVGAESSNIALANGSGISYTVAESADDIGKFAEIAGCLHALGCSEKQIGTPLEEDLASWGHHVFPKSVPDAILQASAGDEVTFVFTNQVDGKLVPVEPKDRAGDEKPRAQNRNFEMKKSASLHTLNKPLQLPSKNLTCNNDMPVRTPSLIKGTKLLRTSLLGLQRSHLTGKTNSVNRNAVTSDVSDDDFE